MTSKDENPAPAAFHVVSQQETTVVNAAGRVQRVMQISFTTGSGINGSVNVPVDNYSVTTARDAIMAKLGVLEGVAGLTG